MEESNKDRFTVGANVVVSWDVVVDQKFVDDVVVSEEAASVSVLLSDSLVELKEEDMTDSVVDSIATSVDVSDVVDSTATADDDASDVKLTKTLNTIKNKNRELTLYSLQL